VIARVCVALATNSENHVRRFCDLRPKSAGCAKAFDLSGRQRMPTDRPGTILCCKRFQFGLPTESAERSITRAEGSEGKARRGFPEVDGSSFTLEGVRTELTR
jgi:hypothetical protein